MNPVRRRDGAAAPGERAVESWRAARPSGGRRWAIVIAVFACMASRSMGSSLAAFAEEAPDTRQAKAEMLYNVAKFIRWPGNSFQSPEGEFVFSILGEDPMAEVIATTLAGKSIAGRPIFVRFVRRTQDLIGSQIAYIAASEEGRLAETLQSLQGRSILTVSDLQGFIARGGMMDFSYEADRVRFEIHRERAEKAGLKISSKLLAIARLVEPGE